MPQTTHVHIKYRTPYMSGKELPVDVEKLMRREITNMRKDLIRKQNALERSKEFKSDTRLKSQLQALKVKDLHTTKQVWNTWNRLYGLELSNKTSVTGRRETRNRELESLQVAGYNVTKKSLPAFGEFMETMRTEYAQYLFSSNDVALEFFNLYSSDRKFKTMTTQQQISAIITGSYYGENNI